MATTKSARFDRAVGPGGTFPKSGRVEIMFCGRSNVGKSSLLNALTGVKGLARTSKTPGRTRQIHFYEMGADRYLVDLPGYGYARVSKAERRAWARLVEAYLARSERIGLAVILIDSRHPPFAMDLDLAASLEAREIPYIVALTKTDRSGTAERSAALRAAREGLGAPMAILLTSARSGLGIRDLARWVEGAAAGRKSFTAGTAR